MKVLFWMFNGFDRHATSEHLLVAIIEQLCKAGHSVHIIQKNSGGPLPQIPEKLSVYPVTTDVIPFKTAEKGNLIARYFVEWKYIQNCKKFLKAGYDAVFIQSTYVGGFAVSAVRRRLPRAVITFNVQDIFPYNAACSGRIKKRGLVFKVLAAVQRYCYIHSDRIITISEDMRDTLVSDGVPADKIEVIYNWSYQDEPYREMNLSNVSHMFDRRYFNVVYAGNIGLMQNVGLLVDTAKLMEREHDVWFHIIGDGLYKEKLKKRATDLGISNISFWPLQPPEISPEIYSAADVNVIPLVKDAYKTALPSKTATCLACPKPVILAIGINGKFANQAKEIASCYISDSDDPKGLYQLILAIKNGDVRYINSDFFTRYCSMSKNSKRYSEIIVSQKC